jgi:ribosomal protein S18 acetylase RimI-like enzyme
MAFSIRPATPADYDAVGAVYAEVERLHRDAAPHVFRAPDGPALNPEYFESMLADADAVWLVAEHHGEIWGFVTAQIVYAPDRPILVPRRYAEVDNLAVLRQHRRAGIGRALMERAHAWAAERGIHEVELNVYEFNQDAIAFYEELGYVTERRKMRRIISDANS